jgi:hypothetical protein
VPYQAEAAGEHRRPTEALQDAGEDQHERVRGEHTEHRGSGEQQRPGNKRPAPPAIVADHSAAQQSCGRPDVHRAEHPGLSTGSGAQAGGGAYQRRQRGSEGDEDEQRSRRRDGEGATRVGWPHRYSWASMSVCAHEIFFDPPADTVAHLTDLMMLVRCRTPRR